MARFSLTLRMLSPVHVGTGEELTPESYVIRQEDGAAVLAAIDLPALLSSLTEADRNSFNLAADADDLVAIRRFVREQAASGRFDLWTAGVDPDLEDRYQRGLDDVSAELAIHPMTRTGRPPQPYIPGSSLKGAIRTAVLQRLVDQSGRADDLHRQWPGRAKSDGPNLEADILGCLREDQSGRKRAEIRADPFRAVRITDAPIRGAEGYCVTFVGRAVVTARPRPSPSRGRGRPGADPAGIQLFYEATFSALHDGEPIEAVGEMTFEDRLAQADASRARGWSFPHPVSRPLAAGEILEACNAFYLPRLETEAGDFGSVSQGLRAAYDVLRREAEAAKRSGAALLRLGRFSHVECMTLAPPLRSVRGGGASRTIITGPCPLGWAALRLEPVQS